METHSEPLKIYHVKCVLSSSGNNNKTHRLATSQTFESERPSCNGWYLGCPKNFNVNKDFQIGKHMFLAELKT